MQCKFYKIPGAVSRRCHYPRTHTHAHSMQGSRLRFAVGSAAGSAVGLLGGVAFVGSRSGSRSGWRLDRPSGSRWDLYRIDL